MKSSKYLGKKAIVSLLLSAFLFCLPVGAFFMNRGNACPAFAAEGTEESGENGSESSVSEDNSGDNAGAQSSESTDETETDTGESNNENEETDGKENEEQPPVCICDDKCSRYELNQSCPVCKADFVACTYVAPNVRITISTPSGWYSNTAKVCVSVVDVATSGNFEIAKVEARIGQNGTWTEITDDMNVEISENCTIYVKVTDQKGRTYEKNKSIKCFDFTKPTLNAAISDGVLMVQGSDLESGIKSIYVNGYKYEDLDEGLLTIRLEKFDAGYEYFLIYAKDNAGNTSETYRTKNPYYKDPADESDDNPAEQLPTSAKPTSPGSATAVVTEHTRTDSKGNTTSQPVSNAEQKKQAMRQADEAEQNETQTVSENNGQSESGKEFYTIQTAKDKVFYLIIDRDGDEEIVYFLTEITENDLLNTTSDNSETLPKNSAALDNGIPVEDNALPNNNTEVSVDNGQQTDEPEKTDEKTDEEENTGENTEDTEETNKKEPAKENTMAGYIIMGIIGAAAIGGGYYFKVVRKKEGFLDEEDDEDDDPEEFIEDDAEEKDEKENDFFEQEEIDAADTIDE